MQTSERRSRREPSGCASSTFADVDIRRELSVRPRRAVCPEAERDALVELAAELTDNPRNILQRLAEIAVELCVAHTAGISLLEGGTIRWEALSGTFESARYKTLPIDRSPCSVCISEDRTQLMYLPDRCFNALPEDPRFVELLLVPFHDHGKPVGTLWIASHSEDRKFDRENERQLRMLADFAAAGWQLSKARDAAVDSGRRKDEFLATLGHELRNPLAAITMAASVVTHEVEANVRAVRAADVITRQCRHLSRLTDDLMDAGRIASGKLQLELKQVSIAQIVSDAIETCRPRVEERQLDIFVDPPDVSTWILADATRLTQTFCNLIDNAAKYTSPGGRIFVTSSVGPRTVSVAVGDTGRGMHRDELQVIFEPFVQLTDSRGTRSSGLGLGLSLVRSVVELHHGTVTGESDGPGKGSRFTVILPLRPAS